MSTTAPQEHRQDEFQRNVLMDVSNAMVGLYKEQFGRGPTQARAAWAGENLLVVTLEGTLTQAERNMVRIGEHQRLRDTRMFFQYATIDEFCGAVEEITGRKVRSFLSGVDTQVDGLSLEAFVMHPEGYEGPSRTEVLETTR